MAGPKRPSPSAPATSDDGKGKDKDEKDDKGASSESHGGAVRDAAQDARENSTGPGRGREISEAARAALGKPEAAVVSAQGLLVSLGETQGLVVGPAGETPITLTADTRYKTADDSDAALADVAALVPVAVRVRGRSGPDGSLVTLRLEVRGEADGVTVELDGVIDAVSTTGFTLVTRAGTAPTGTTATTTSAPTGTTATTTSAPTGTTVTTTAGTAPTGSTATGTVSVGGTYTVIVGADTTIRRNDVTSTLAALQSGDEVEARGALDGTTLTATRVLADGPAATGTPATTTAAVGTPVTTTSSGS